MTRAAVEPERYVEGRPQRRFTRGSEKPRGVKWFGVQSFWGHLRHLAALAIATEDVDSRSWMTADEPDVLLRRVCRTLAIPTQGTSLTACLGRDLWIDYLADSGDDAAVSAAVARLLFETYRLPDPDVGDTVLNHSHAKSSVANTALLAPRGDVLFFGGDIAYPVGTAEEITNRVLVPFNQVLLGLERGTERVLLGLPGNHDWYDGLDGFARMFRHRETSEAQSGAPLSRQKTTLIERYAIYAREFVRGGQIEKPNTLELLGYTPVQNASYFALPLAPGIDLLAVDRQLKRVDQRQQEYFQRVQQGAAGSARWLTVPDPPFAFGRRSPTGCDVLAALGLPLDAQRQFVLSGDIHHYRREQLGETLLVTAGGGGAFLHPASLRDEELKPVQEWPGRRQSLTLLAQVPWKVAQGRSGILPHAVLASLFGPWFVAVALGSVSTGWWAPLLFVPLLSGVLSLMAGPARVRIATHCLAFCAALLCAALACTGALWGRYLLVQAAGSINAWAALFGLLALAVVLSVFVFGGYLALLTRFGLESTQAFTALDHPGFKHFVRFRVRADGSAVDGWCIGLVDPLAPNAQPVLVDSFTWRVGATQVRPSEGGTLQKE